MTDNYVLHDPDTGRWYYHLPRPAQGPLVDLPSNARLHFGGQPAESAQAQNWYVSDVRVDGVDGAVEWVWPGFNVVVGYRLKDPAAVSERFPLTLTVAEFDSRTAEDYDDARSEHILYERVTEPGVPGRLAVTLAELLVLDGTPPEPHAGTWVADLPRALSQYPEFRHLFPGKLHGFHDALFAVLKEKPGVKYVLDEKWGRSDLPVTGNCQVTVETEYDPPVIQHRPATNRDGSRSRSRRGHDVRLSYPARILLPAPTFIPGANLAEAAAGWDAQMAESVDQVERAGRLVTCGHCLGTGISGTESTARPATR